MNPYEEGDILPLRAIAIGDSVAGSKVINKRSVGTWWHPVQVELTLEDDVTIIGAPDTLVIVTEISVSKALDKWIDSCYAD